MQQVHLHANALCGGVGAKQDGSRGWCVVVCRASLLLLRGVSLLWLSSSSSSSSLLLLLLLSLSTDSVPVVVAEGVVPSAPARQKKKNLPAVRPQGLHANLERAPPEVAERLASAPVQCLQLPLPAALAEPATAAMKALFEQAASRLRRGSTGGAGAGAGVDAGTAGAAGRSDGAGAGHHHDDDDRPASDAGLPHGTGSRPTRNQTTPFLCRVDLLPCLTMSASGRPRVEWLFSEAEGQWCECFLRAAPPRVARRIAQALVTHRSTPSP